jgi:citrate synthase
MGMVDPEAENRAKTASWDRGVAVLARFPAAVAALYRLQQGLDPVEPDPELSQAANFLSMLTGSIPAASAARVMDQALIMHADHELNASTFTARVAASTLTDMYSAITAALCTLKGPLHGGAAEGVRRTLEEIEAVDQVPAWVAEAQRRKQRIMGFGHRIYREGDPRARLLKALSRQLADASGDSRWYDVSVRLEEEVRRSHGLLPNVDFYSASVYTYLGIPPELYTPIFAVGRVGGWIAHIMEQYADNRLIRPRAEYIGPSPRTYIDMEKR